MIFFCQLHQHTFISTFACGVIKTWSNHISNKINNNVKNKSFFFNYCVNSLLLVEFLFHETKKGRKLSRLLHDIKSRYFNKLEIIYEINKLKIL